MLQRCPDETPSAIAEGLNAREELLAFKGHRQFCEQSHLAMYYWGVKYSGVYIPHVVDTVESRKEDSKGEHALSMRASTILSPA